MQPPLLALKQVEQLLDDQGEQGISLLKRISLIGVSLCKE